MDNERSGENYSSNGRNGPNSVTPFARKCSRERGCERKIDTERERERKRESIRMKEFEFPFLSVYTDGILTGAGHRQLLGNVPWNPLSGQPRKSLHVRVGDRAAKYPFRALLRCVLVLLPLPFRGYLERLEGPSQGVRRARSLQRVTVGAAVRVRGGGRVREGLGRPPDAPHVPRAPRAGGLGTDARRTSLHRGEPLLGARRPAPKPVQIAVGPR